MMNHNDWSRRLLALFAAGMLALTACGSKEVDSSNGDRLFDSAGQNNQSASGSGAQDDQSGLSSGAQDDGQQDSGSGTAVANDGYEKFLQLQIGMTESEVNAILGEPVNIDKAYYTYNVTVNGKDMDLTVWISTVTGQVIYLSGEFDGSDYRDAFVDSQTDLSAVDRLESGELDTYEACAEAFKTPGYLYSIDEDGETRYFWVNSNGGYIRVTFRPDGTVKTYSGFC